MACGRLLQQGAARLRPKRDGTRFPGGQRIPTPGQRAARDELFYSDLGYEAKQFALFGEGTLPVGERLNLTAGLRYYNFDEDRTQIFDGIFGNDNNGTSLVSNPGSTKANGLAPRLMASYKASDQITFNAQASKGFRLGGINDPLNVPICTPQDLVTFGGRDSWKDETAWNYEIGAKSMLDGRASLNVSAYYMDISDLQLTVTAGSCTSRLVFNVPKARSSGLEVEFGATPNEHFDFSVNASLNNGQLRSTLTSTDANHVTTVVSGIKEGNRLPSVPEVQGSAAATYRWRAGRSARPFVTASYRHVGLAIHPDRRSGCRLRDRQLERVPEHDRRAAHAEYLYVQLRSCRRTIWRTCASA